MCEMLPQIALKSGTFIAKILKNQGSNKYFEVSKSTRVVTEHDTRQRSRL
jgi:phosphomannomutase